MESIILFLAQPVFFILNLLINFKIFYLQFKNDVPGIVNVLNFSKDVLLIYLQGLNFFFTLRFMLIWFPNINPFIAPFYIVRVITQPVLDPVEKRLPKIFGMDFSFLLCSLAINIAINKLSTYTFY